MDAANMRMAKLQFGRIPTSVGVYTPAVSAPHGRMWGLSAQQTVLWKGMSLTPEFAYTHFAQGVDPSGSQRKNLRAGVVVAVGL
jgi:hypothetical protein